MKKLTTLRNIFSNNQVKNIYSWVSFPDLSTTAMGSFGRFLFSSDVFTVAGYLWSLFDYGSDIAVGVDYHNRCHFKWAITTFVISFMPNMVFTCYIFSEHFKSKINELKCHTFPKFISVLCVMTILPIVGILLPFIHGYYVYQTLKTDRIRRNESPSQEHNERILKKFKTLTMICESIPQLIFTSYCYVRAFYTPNKELLQEDIAWKQIMSMIVSFISIVFGLLNRHRYVRRKTEHIKFCGFDTLKKMIALTLGLQS